MYDLNTAVSTTKGQRLVPGDLLEIGFGDWVNGWAHGPGPSSELSGDQRDHTGIILVLAVIPWPKRSGGSWWCVLFLSRSGLGWIWHDNLTNDSIEVLHKMKEQTTCPAR